MAYIQALRPRVVGQPLISVRILSPFVLRSFEPPIEAAEGREVIGLSRIGKRFVFDLGDEHYLLIHLMIAGRFRWLDSAARLPGKITLAAFAFPSGTLALTEAGSKKRAALHMIRGRNRLAAHDPGGIEVLQSDLADFAAALLRENHTLKRSLTDPRLFSGIGNAFSDEILHAARLSPVTLTSRLSDEQVGRLHAATRQVLSEWIERLSKRFEKKFPGAGEVTAFRPEFAVHGRFGQPCPVCGAAVQRIRYAENETNYCPGCQTGGRILADRSLSRLLKQDWPRTLEELEERQAR